MGSERHFKTNETREGGGRASVSECYRASLARSSFWKDYKECECMEKKALNIDSSR